MSLRRGELPITELYARPAQARLTRISSSAILLQSISATDLIGEFMILCPGDLRAGCLRRDALPQPPHGDPDDVALGAVDGPGDCASVGRRQALRASELADGILGRCGAQI